MTVLWNTTALGQSHTVYLNPVFLFNEGDSNPPTPYRTKLSVAIADVIAIGDYCYTYSDGASQCQTLYNFHDDTTDSAEIYCDTRDSYGDIGVPIL